MHVSENADIIRFDLILAIQESVAYKFSAHGQGLEAEGRAETMSLVSLMGVLEPSIKKRPLKRYLEHVRSVT